MLPDAKLYIDGVMRGAADGKTYDNIGPWTGEVVGKAADATAQDVSAAIAAARRAFDGTDWSTQHSFRHELMIKYRDLLVANRDKLVEIVRHEVGSAMGAAHSAQVAGALEGATGLIDAFPSVRWEEDRGRRRQCIVNRGVPDDDGIDFLQFCDHVVLPRAMSFERWRLYLFCVGA